MSDWQKAGDSAGGERGLCRASRPFLTPYRQLREFFNSLLGYDLANMLTIADAAGVTKATLYAYFENKAQLFRAVIEHWMEQLPEPALAYPVDGDLRAQLNEVAQALWRQAGHPASLALARLLARSNWIAQKRWRQRHRPYRSYLEQTLSRCTRSLRSSCCWRSAASNPIASCLWIKPASLPQWIFSSRPIRPLKNSALTAPTRLV